MANAKKKRRRSARPKQLELEFHVKGWGGYRPGSGAKKKPKGEAGVSHAKRELMTNKDCGFLTFKLRSGLPSLRQVEEDRVLRGVLRDARKEGFRIIHYVVMSNHLHLLVEANDNDSLSRAMTGLGRRISANLNKLWNRKGSLFEDRYHLSVKRTPIEVRNAIAYVLKNAYRHGVRRLRGIPDFYSSAEYFDGWSDCGSIEIWEGSPVERPRTFNLGVGWKKAGGLLSLRDRPGGKRTLP